MSHNRWFAEWKRDYYASPKTVIMNESLRNYRILNYTESIRLKTWVMIRGLKKYWFRWIRWFEKRNHTKNIDLKSRQQIQRIQFSLIFRNFNKFQQTMVIIPRFLEKILDLLEILLIFVKFVEIFRLICWFRWFFEISTTRWFRWIRWKINGNIKQRFFFRSFLEPWA